MALARASREQVLLDAQFLNGFAISLFAACVPGTVGTFTADFPYELTPGKPDASIENSPRK